MARKRFSEHVRGQKRNDILDGAMAVFEKYGGLEALSFRKLASEMNLSYSAPYRYFASKEELVNALRTRAYRWIEHEMLEAIKGIASPEKQLELLAAAYIRSGIQRPHRYALMFFNLNDTEAARRSLELKAAKRDALDVCTRTIAAGQASGDFPKTIDPLTAAHMFWIGAHGVVSLEVSGQFLMGRSVEVLVPTLIGILRNGMEYYKAAQAPHNDSSKEETRHERSQHSL